MALTMSDQIDLVLRMNGDEIVALVSSNFDIDYYMATNPDVLASDWSAPEHYLQHGWREARYPSAHFAACAHLFDGLDLPAQGINPFALFLIMRSTGTGSDLIATAAELNNPLISHRAKGRASYAAGLAGISGWEGIATEAPNHGGLRAWARRLRLQLKDRADAPIVLLPADPWAGSMEIARLFNENHAVFIRLGGSIPLDHWQTHLITVIDLSAAAGGDAEQLLLDIMRGIHSPLLIDLGNWTLGKVPLRHAAEMKQRITRFVAFLPPDNSPITEPPDWITTVQVSAASENAANDEIPADRLTIAPLAWPIQQLRNRIEDICFHAV